MKDDEVDDGVDRHVPVPVDAGSVGPNQAEQVQHHEPAQDTQRPQPFLRVAGGRQLLPDGEDEDEHYGGVQVEQGHVAGIAGVTDYGVAGKGSRRRGLFPATRRPGV